MFKFGQLLCWVLVFFSSALFAQVKPVAASIINYENSGAAFEQYNLFARANKINAEAASFAQDGQFLTLSTSKLQTLLAAKPAGLSLQLPFHGDQVIVDLIKVSIHTEDFSALLSDGSTYEYEQGVHYRGIIRGDENSLASISVFKDDIMGLFSNDRYGNMVLGKLDIRGNVKDYILYTENKLTKANPFKCGVIEPPTEPHGSGHANGNPEVNGCVRVFLEADYELFQNKVTVQGTINWLSGMFNQMATLYTNETISTRLSQVYIWVAADSYDNSSSGTALNQFRTLRTSFNADLAHLISLGGNNVGGVAWLDVLCNSTYNRAYSNVYSSYSTVPTYSWTIMVITHEMGHNLGSNHTQWCGWTGGALDNCYTTEGGCAPGPPPVNGGTVMSYCHLTSNGINLANGFGSQPGNAIRTRVSGATCLTATCSNAPSCGAPSGISVSNIGSGAATIAWNAVGGASSYSLQWRSIGATSWNTLSGVTSPYVVSGLPANDEIEAQLQATCSGVNSGYVYGVIFISGGGSTSCTAPSSLNVSSIAQNTATVSWPVGTGATAYRLSYKTSAATTWGTEITVNANTYALSGLTASTAYNVRVRSVCGTAFSAYVTANFSTIANPSCTKPTGLNATNITATTANMTWSAVSGAQAYDLQYRLSNNPAWITISNIPTNSHQLTGLQANKTYRTKVRTKCAGTNNYSAYSAEKTFTTPAQMGGGNGSDMSVGNDREGIDNEDAITLPMEGDMLLSPNPTTGFVTVSLSMSEIAQVQVDLLDMNGKLIQQQQVTLQEGAVQFDLTGLPLGVYMFRSTRSNYAPLVKRIVKGAIN